MRHQLPKVLHAHLMVLGSHCHVGVPDEVHINWGHSKHPGCHLPQLQEQGIPGNDPL